jgi:hypothetical protein
VRQDPIRKGLLFAGTENAVWVSFDDGDHWQSLQFNLPHTSMRDLWIKDSDLIVATHGRSFWILDDITPLRQFDSKAMQSGGWLATPATAFRVQRDTNPDTPIPPDEPIAENPPDGAVIDFFLGQTATGPVKLEILDAAGKVIRRYSSADLPQLTAADLTALSIPPWWVQPSRVLPASSGLHRWVWDLHETAPVSLRHDYPISAVPFRTPAGPEGPLAIPGAYTVQLIADGQTYKAPLIVKLDPRVKISPLDLRKQLDAQRLLASAISKTTAAIREARSVQEQIEKALPAAQGPMKDRLTALGAKIKAALGSVTPVNGQASGLYGSLGSADGAPTAAQSTALSKIGHDAPLVIGAWEKLRSGEIEPLNQDLKSAGLPAILIVQPAAQPDDSDDSDDIG